MRIRDAGEHVIINSNFCIQEVGLLSRVLFSNKIYVELLQSHRRIGYTEVVTTKAVPH